MNDASTLAYQHCDSERADADEIRMLTTKYVGYVNSRWGLELVDFERLREVFAENATWACQSMGVAVAGQSDIIAMLRDKTASGELSMHIFPNSIIEIDGDIACGNWVLWIAIKSRRVAREVLQSEDIGYVRTEHGWRIQSIDLRLRDAHDSD